MVLMPRELAAEFSRSQPFLSEERIFLPSQELRDGLEIGRHRRVSVSRSPAHVRELGDLYELAKIFGHSKIKMTGRYAKLAYRQDGWDGS